MRGQCANNLSLGVSFETTRNASIARRTNDIRDEEKDVLCGFVFLRRNLPWVDMPIHAPVLLDLLRRLPSRPDTVHDAESDCAVATDLRVAQLADVESEAIGA